MKPILDLTKSITDRGYYAEQFAETDENGNIPEKKINWDTFIDQNFDKFISGTLKALCGKTGSREGNFEQIEAVARFKQSQILGLLDSMGASGGVYALYDIKSGEVYDDTFDSVAAEHSIIKASLARYHSRPRSDLMEVVEIGEGLNSADSCHLDLTPFLYQ